MASVAHFGATPMIFCNRAGAASIDRDWQCPAEGGEREGDAGRQRAGVDMRKRASRPQFARVLLIGTRTSWHKRSSARSVSDAGEVR